MCGLTGFWDRNGGDAEAARSIVGAMADRLAHRGPDDRGVWAGQGVALGHRRLAVVELSAAGHQPLVSACERFVIAFNGEIYNHLEVRNLLQSAGAAPQWRGHSDTETLLAAISHWGLKSALQRANGMFALALWDRKERTLSLARDRIGEKPMYYGWAGSVFVFGSELKALQAHPEFSAVVSTEALAQYLRHCYIPAPLSIWHGVYKLQPAAILTLCDAPPHSPPNQPLRTGSRHGTLAIDAYWSLAETAEAGARNPICDETEALQRLEELLERAVGRQMAADVPLGAFLSGGVDSSTIVALMQKQSSSPVRTFTIGFDEAGFDEAPHAAAIARHLGTDHSEIRVTDTEARSVIPLLPQLYDEPFADSSQIPTFLVSQAARSQVTVALSGDAGDELFGGYNRYFWGPAIWRKLGWMPIPLRKAVGGMMQAVPRQAWDGAGRGFNRMASGSSGIGQMGDKAHKLAKRLQTARSLADFHLDIVTEWDSPGSLLQAGLDGPGRSALFDFALPSSGTDSVQTQMMFRDLLTYLPDDILCKVDRAAMGVSLETRVPFLDREVVEFAWQLPLDMKLRGNVSKWAIREILYRRVPKELIERPKAGFSMPVGQWLRGPLREWAEELLSPGRLETEGYLLPAPIRAVWQEHLSGRRDWTPRLWTILMFQAWLECQK